MHGDARWILQLLFSAFLAVLFLQSGLDKVLDWKGNREYIQGHLAKSPLRPFSGLLFLMITFMEVGAGVLSAAGCLSVFVSRSPALMLLGAALSGASILSLFVGQRLAKDYAGAASLAPYFLVCCGAVWAAGA